MELKKLVYKGVFGLLLVGIISCSNGGNEEQTGSGSDQANDTSSMSQQNPLSGQQGQQLSADDVSDEELKNFMQVAQQLRPIQMQARQEILGIIEASEQLNVERFQEISQSKRDPSAADTMDISSSEEEEFQSISDTSRQIQQDAQSDIQAKVEEAGMDWDRFRQISMALRSNPELQQKIRQIQQEQMGGGPGGGGPGGGQQQMNQEQLKQRLQERMQEQQQQQQQQGN